MSDVSVAPEQDAIAESLLGDPEVEQTVEQPETEQPEAQLQEEPTEQIEQQETADDWLPTEQEKVFPDEVLLRYAQRYGRDEQWLSDPLNRQLIHDKINTDIYLRTQQQQAQEFTEEEPEQQEPTQQPQLSREQYFQNLDRMIQERTDPQVAKDFHAGFLRAFGVPEAEIAKAPAEQAQAFTGLMSKYALNLMNTFFPDLLQSQLGPQLSTAFPGFGEMYERSAYAVAWDKVRNSNAQYGTLPAYGTKEFSKTLHEAEQKFPELIAAFAGSDGKIPTAKAAQAYSILAKIATGQNVDPALLQKAAAAGAKNAKRAAQTRANGNLGSGQSKAASSSSGSSKFQTNQDIFDDEAMGLYQREHGRL